MSKVIAFTVPKSSGLYQLELADTLVGFLDYDFTYFWEQCLELAHKSRLTGEYYADYSRTLKEYIRTCHPYYNVLIHTDFDKIVLDCILDFISLSESVGLEELWVRYISAKDSFGREVFARISEYKTGSAINQWANLLRMQEYAAAKAAFVFDGGLVSPYEYNARKQYFDLAFSLAATEMGYRHEELPSVKRSPVSLLPEAAEISARVTNSLLPAVRPLVHEKRPKHSGKKSNCMQDQAAGLVFNAIAELRRPGPVEMEAATDFFREQPQEVYFPTCLKAIIDLEFDKMLENGLILKRKPDGKGYVIAGHFGRDIPVAAQITPQQPPAEHVKEYAPPVVEPPEPAEPEELTEPAATVTDEPVISENTLAGNVVYPAPPVTLPNVDATPEEVAAAAKPEPPPAPAETAPKKVQRIASQPERVPSGKKTAQNINVRCQLVYTALYACVTNKTMSETEFEEWSHQLMGIRRSIIKRDMTVDDLERYLDATEEIYPQIAQGANE